jgi:hypothetical protein
MQKFFKKLIKKLKRNRLVLFRKLYFIKPDVYLKYLYNYYTGKELNLENPVEFNEKIQWYKLYFQPKILNQLVDKYAVRTYVDDKIGKKYLNDVYGIYSNPKEINFNKLPDKYIIKSTNASGFNLIVENNTKLDKKKTLRLLQNWLVKTNYYKRSQEWAYKNIKPRIVIEKYLKDGDKSSLIDYKFYCFNGDVKFVEIHLDRSKNHKRGFYDLDFNPLPFRYVKLEKSISSKINKPINFDEMIDLATKLSIKIPFVRVDFYSINGKSIFGEMTFYPSGGRKDYIPDAYNKIVGDYFKLPKIPRNYKKITAID